MTAKKMADIFFGKFSELISTNGIENREIENKVVKINIYKKILYIIIAIAILFSIYKII